MKSLLNMKQKRLFRLKEHQNKKYITNSQTKTLLMIIATKNIALICSFYKLQT